jgi:hypothetical protein
MCRRDITDEEAEQIFKALNERFPAEWDVDISWGQAIFDTESYFSLTISKAQLRAIIGSRCDCDDCDQVQ